MLFKSTITNAASDAVAEALTTVHTLPAIAPVVSEAAIAASSALVPATPVLVPHMVPGALYPHQEAGVAHARQAIATWGGALFGHDMGLGKTRMLLAMAADRLGDGPAIIIAPNVTKLGYQDDLAAAFPTLRFHHLYGRTAKPVPAADVYFMSDDPQTMQAWLTVTTVDAKGNKHLNPSPLALSAGCILRDELHRDKGDQAKPNVRGKVMLCVSEALRALGRPVVGATGTLLVNRPIEAMIPLRIIGGDKLVVAVTPGANKPATFKFRYCNPTQVWTGRGYATDFTGCNEDELPTLHRCLRGTVYGRIEKRDLGDILPHGSWQVRPMALNGMLHRYIRLEQEFLQVMREEKGPEAALRSARGETLARLTALRIEAGKAKAPAAAEYIANLVEQGRQVVAFFEHTEVMLALAAKLPNAVTVDVINGQVRDEARSQAVRDFQAGRTQVLLAQTAAAGIGVTLTAAADAVLVQLPWSAGLLKQAADRILRADQRSLDRAKAGEGVTWHVLLTAKEDGTPSIDHTLWDVLETKSRIIDAVNAGQEITMPEGSVLKAALIDWYAAQN